MKKTFGMAFTAVLVLTAPSFAQNAPTPPPASDTPPTVAPAAPGVFTATKKGANGYHLVVTGKKFTSRHDIAFSMAYRASESTQEKKGRWFTATESRAKGDTEPVPHRDPAANRFSFRMEYFRPVWRYKTGTAPDWKRWSPFSGAAFP